MEISNDKLLKDYPPLILTESQLEKEWYRIKDLIINKEATGTDLKRLEEVELAQHNLRSLRERMSRITP